MGAKTTTNSFSKLGISVTPSFNKVRRTVAADAAPVRGDGFLHSGVDCVHIIGTVGNREKLIAAEFKDEPRTFATHDEVEELTR